MERRRFGDTGITVSAIGFGGGGIGHVWGSTTVQDGLRAIQCALDLGIDFFDVAPSYGDGLAEEVLGKGLAGRREDVTIMTKVDVLPSGRDDIAGFVRGSVARSLARLATDHIDCLIIHNAVTSRRGRPYPWCIEIDDARRITDEFVRLREAGLVRFIGFSAWRCTAPSLDVLFEDERFDCIQSEYNLSNPSGLRPPRTGLLGDMRELEDAEEAIVNGYDFRGVDQHGSITRAAALGLGVVAIRPLMGGVFSDRLDRDADPGSDLRLMRDRAEVLQAALDGSGMSLSESAIRYCLAPAEIGTVVLGFKDEAEVAAAVEASRRPAWSPGDLSAVEAMVRRAMIDPLS